MVINTEIPSLVMYRIDHGTNGPMGLTLLAEDARLCAALCGIHSCKRTSEIALYRRGTSYEPYRIGPGTYVPLMFDPTGGGAWCAALCGIPADGDSTAECAVECPTGGSDWIALPSACGFGEGFGLVTSPTSVLSSEVVS